MVPRRWRFAPPGRAALWKTSSRPHHQVHGSHQSAAAGPSAECAEAAWTDVLKMACDIGANSTPAAARLA